MTGDDLTPEERLLRQLFHSQPERVSLRPVELRDIPRRARRARRVRAYRRAAAAATVSAVLLVAGLVGPGWVRDRTSREETQVTDHSAAALRASYIVGATLHLPRGEEVELPRSDYTDAAVADDGRGGFNIEAARVADGQLFLDRITGGVIAKSHRLGTIDKYMSFGGTAQATTAVGPAGSPEPPAVDQTELTVARSGAPGCWQVNDFSESQRVYQTCEYAVVDVTPDGRGVLVTDPDADLFGERYPYLAVIDMTTGARTAVLEAADGDRIGSVAWDSTTKLDVTLFDAQTSTWSVSRFDINDSSVEPALPALPGSVEDAAYRISGQCWLDPDG